MRIKLDENLGKRGAELLSNVGHEVSTVYRQGLGGWQDRDPVELCGREGRALVTLDLGFANPLVFSPMDYTGIAVLRLPRRPTPAHLEEAIGTLVGALGDRPIEGRLWIVELGRIREYQPEREADDE